MIFFYIHNDKQSLPAEIEALGRWFGPKPLTAHGFYIFLIGCSNATIFELFVVSM